VTPQATDGRRGIDRALKPEDAPMNRSIVYACAALMGLVSSVSAGAQDQSPIYGKWLTQDQRAIVEVGNCGDKDCGKIVWIKDPIDPETGRPRQDRHNPDISLQHRPIMGLVTLANITRNQPNTWSAVSYDPRSGEEHDITIRLLATGTKMELQGCGLGGLICRSEIWSQAPDQLPQP
jgi:uncharacterized protein (DUF2147 family)